MPEGPGLVIAELSANGFQVVRQWSHAASGASCSPRWLIAPHRRPCWESLAVLREGNTGAAYVWTNMASACCATIVQEPTVPLRRVRLRCAWLSCFETETLKFPIDVSAPQRPIKPEQTRTVHASHSPWLIPGSEFQLSFLRARPQCRCR